MSIATISEKGQITLPISLRRRLNLRPHDRVTIEGDEESIVIRPVVDFFALEGFLGKALPPEEERERMLEGVARHVLGHDT